MNETNGSVGFVVIDLGDGSVSLEEALDHMLGFDAEDTEEPFEVDSASYHEALKRYTEDLEECLDDLQDFGLNNMMVRCAQVELIMQAYMTGQFFGMPTCGEIMTADGCWINPSVVVSKHIKMLKATWGEAVFSAARHDHKEEYELLIQVANIGARLWGHEFALTENDLLSRIAQLGVWLRNQDGFIEFLVDALPEGECVPAHCAHLDDFTVGILWLTSLLPDQMDVACWDDFSALVDND